jgi:hypothetical protein
MTVRYEIVLVLWSFPVKETLSAKESPRCESQPAIRKPTLSVKVNSPYKSGLGLPGLMRRAVILCMRLSLDPFLVHFLLFGGRLSSFIGYYNNLYCLPSLIRSWIYIHTRITEKILLSLNEVNSALCPFIIRYMPIIVMASQIASNKGHCLWYI